MRPLPHELRPREVSINLGAAEPLIGGAEYELRQKAEADESRCYGYFPGAAGMLSVDSDLPACLRLAQTLPALDVDGKPLSFSFLRLSTIGQTRQYPLHIDSDTSTAMTGDPDTLDRRLVWRLLLNLSAAHGRTLIYANLDARSVRMERTDCYVRAAEPLDERTIETVRLAPRRGAQVHGVLFCASRVLHSGHDGAHGHFVAAFGREDQVARDETWAPRVDGKVCA